MFRDDGLPTCTSWFREGFLAIYSVDHAPVFVEKIEISHRKSKFVSLQNSSPVLCHEAKRNLVSARTGVHYHESNSNVFTNPNQMALTEVHVYVI